MRTRHPFRHALATSLALLSLAACDDSSGANKPDGTLQIVASGEAKAFAGGVVPITLKVEDPDGESTAGTEVVLSVTAGGGSVSPDHVVLDAAGVGHADWTIGAAGNNTLSGTVRSRHLTIESTVTALATPTLAVSDIPAGRHVVGEAVPIQATVSSGGAPVQGARVRFTVASGGGSVTAADVQTDASGIARTTWTLGSGGNILDATVVGTAVTGRRGVLGEPPIVVKFEADSVVVPGIGCTAELFAAVTAGGVLQAASSVQFTSGNEGLFTLTIPQVAGTTREMRRTVTALQPGVTTVIARHSSGAADTARVEVKPDATARVVYIEPGYTVFIGIPQPQPAVALNGCSRAIANAPITYRSLNPAIATVDAAGVLNGVRGGETMVIASAGAVADTAVIKVPPTARMTMTPGDTTVFVGASVQYRIRAFGPDSAAVTPGESYFRLGSGAAASIPGGSTTFGTAVTVSTHAVGTETITGYADGREVRSTLRIIAAP